MNLAQNIVIASTSSEALSEGIVTLVVGMSVVFVTLIILVVILEMSGKFFSSLELENKKKIVEPQIKANVVDDLEESNLVDDLELIAVITAAIAVSMGTTADNLQVRSIRKVNNSWSKQGRIEQLYN